MNYWNSVFNIYLTLKLLKFCKSLIYLNTKIEYHILITIDTTISIIVFTFPIHHSALHLVNVIMISTDLSVQSFRVYALRHQRLHAYRHTYKDR